MTLTNTDEDEAVCLSMDDQIIKILQVVGHESRNDLQFVNSEQNLEFLKEALRDLDSETDQTTLAELHVGAHPDLVDLLEGALRFNPNQRASSSELLKYKAFEDLIDEGQ